LTPKNRKTENEQLLADKQAPSKYFDQGKKEILSPAQSL